LDAGIVTNRNAVPQDPHGAWYTSGVRIGTPALTTRGLGLAEMDHIAELITTVLINTQPSTDAAGSRSKATYVIDAAVAAKVSGQAADLLSAYPLYPNITLP
jgi:glycine hydroxymethyltransferase